MKKILLVIILLLSVNSYAAIDSIEGQWVLGTTYNDASTNSYDLTESGTLTASDGHDGGTGLATAFSANTNFLSITKASAPRLYPTTGSFYISGWIKSTTTPGRTNAEVIAAVWDTNADRSYILWLFGDDVLFGVSTDGNTTAASATNTTTIAADTYYHVVAVRDATANQLRLYVDTVLEDTQSFTGTLKNPTGPFKIGQGGSFWESTSDTTFQGSLDDIEFGWGVPTTAEISALYALGDDFSPANSINISTPTTNQPYQRDGSNQYDIPIIGTYSYDGTAPPIEAGFAGGPFVTIDATPTGGTFSATLDNQAGGQGDLIVRFTTATDVNDTVTNISIGEIVLITGESGPEGRLTNNQTYSSTDGFTAMMYKDGTSVWAELADPTDSGTGSFWPLLATKMMNELHVPVAFITTADGSTGVAGATLNQWDKAGSATSYNKCISQVSGANVNDIRIVITELGLNDASESVTQSAFQTALSTLLDNLQADTGFSNMQMVLINSSNYYNTGIVTNTDLNNVRLGQLNRWLNDSDIFPGPVLYDLDTSSLPEGDGIHLKGNPEAILYTERGWANIEQAFFSGTNGVYPVKSSIVLTDTDEITATFTSLTTPLQSARVSDWRMTDDTGTLTPSTAVIANNKVVLTFSRALDTNPVLSLGYGNDGSGTAFRDSNINVPSLGGVLTGLPVAPFVEESVAEIPEYPLLMMMFK